MAVKFKFCEQWLGTKVWTGTIHLTTGFWGKEAWCPPSKWNTRFFFAFSLGLKEMEKFFWEGRKKSLLCWLSQFSFAELRQPTGQTFFPTFPMQRKTWYFILGVDTMPLSLKNLLLNGILLLLSPQIFRHSYDPVDQELSKREWISLSSDITFFQRWVTTWVKVR